MVSLQVSDEEPRNGVAGENVRAAATWVRGALMTLGYVTVISIVIGSILRHHTDILAFPAALFVMIVASGKRGIASRTAYTGAVIGLIATDAMVIVGFASLGVAPLLLVVVAFLGLALSAYVLLIIWAALRV